MRYSHNNSLHSFIDRIGRLGIVYNISRLSVGATRRFERPAARATLESASPAPRGADSYLSHGYLFDGSHSNRGDSPPLLVSQKPNASGYPDRFKLARGGAPGLPGSAPARMALLARRRAARAGPATRIRRTGHVSPRSGAAWSTLPGGAPPHPGAGRAVRVANLATAAMPCFGAAMAWSGSRGACFA